MNDPQTWAIAYFATRHNPAWRWTDDGDWLVWNDGTTVAYRQEIVLILEWLVPHGWPPFGALVWVLAACRGILPPQPNDESGRKAPAREGNTETADSASQLDLFRDRIVKMHATVEHGLKTIAKLPSEMRSTWKAKAVIAEVVFAGEGCEVGRPELLEAVLNVLRSGRLTDIMLNDYGGPVEESSGEWVALHGGMARFDPATLALRLQTGLDVMPQPAEVQLPPAVRVRQVIDELRSDAEHAGLARLVRDFMAAIQLPRRLSEQDELATGGFADIANRGDPDRLLLSELAHDDLTLAVRIALNEALYLRREPPARQPPGTLAVLLDSGVRLWGTPRVLATATALALVAKGVAHEECAVFRASGARIVPVDLLTKKGVVAHLAALEPQAHPGAALAAFRARLDEDERPEAVLVTQREVWADPDFQRDLAMAQFENLYAALVDRDGTFTLLRYPRGGGPLSEAVVDVNALFPEERGAAKRAALIERAANPDLPLALSKEPFPFLLPVRGKIQKAILLANGGGACVMQDRRLLAWKAPSRGARTIASELPRGCTLWLGELDDGAFCVVKAVEQNRRLLCVVFSPDGDLRHFHDWRFSEYVVRVESRGGVVFIVRHQEAEVRDIVSGSVLGTTPIPRGRSHGRYFLTHPHGWCVLSWNGWKLQLDRLVLLEGLCAQGILRVFQNPDAAGPWVLTQNGDVHRPDGNRVLQLGPLKPVVRISEDGRRLLVASPHTAGCRLVDLRTNTVRPVQGTVRDADWIWKPQPPTWTVRVRMQGITVLDGAVWLYSSQKGWRQLSYHLGADGVFLLPTAGPRISETMRDFVPVLLPNQPGFSLKVASWPDGRRAWLDSRGLLHLRCANRSLPELTIVLNGHGPFQMWMSTGQISGTPFFLDEQSPTPVSEFLPVLGAFVKPP